VDGSPLAISKASNLLRAGEGIDLQIPGQAGTQEIDLKTRLEQHAEIEETGVRIRSVEPVRILNVTLNEIVSMVVPVQPVFPIGVQPDGETTVEPKTVTIDLLRQDLPAGSAELYVEAVVEHDDLRGKKTGDEHHVEAMLRGPASLGLTDKIMKTDPDRVELSFHLRNITLDSVRVQLAGPPEDFAEYRITLEPAVLLNVTISGEDEVLRKIESGEANVVAMVHLSNRDKEQAIRTKAVAYFVALASESARGDLVEGRMEGVNENEGPIVGVTIERLP
jgi:hypothetical protein